jgi:hypothetical protein
MTECPRCGSRLDDPRKPHHCDRLDAPTHFGTASTAAERREVSEKVRQIYGIPPEIWWDRRANPASPDTPRRQACGCIW